MEFIIRSGRAGEEDLLREASPIYGGGLVTGQLVGYRRVGSLRQFAFDSVQNLCTLGDPLITESHSSTL